MLRKCSVAICCQALFIVTTLRAADIGTAFTYQGSLENGSGPVTDTCDFQFGLWNDAAAGAQSGVSPQTVALVDVVAGTFTVSLDFGVGAINGDARWLEIEVQCPGDAGFVLLAPRVELTPAPHALRASTGVGPPAALEVDSVNGRIGIGTTTPDEPLTVVGTVHSTAGGFRFPDGSVQATADTGDTLAGLSCAASEVAKWDGSQWVCAADQDTDTDTDTDTLGGLSCAAGEIAKWDGAAWACSSDGGGDGHSLDAVDGDPIDAVYVNEDGRVGIGTTAPTQPLHVVGTVMAQNPGTSPVGSTVRFGGPSGDPGLVIQKGDGIGGVARQWEAVIEHDNTLEIRDNTAGGLERLMIDTTGRVGIGTTTPITQLDVSGDLHASGTIASGNSIVFDGTAGMERIVSSDALEIHTSTGRILRLEPETTAGVFVGPNLIGGYTGNNITSGVTGATIAGGGGIMQGSISANTVTDHFATVGGGLGNRAGNNAGTPDDSWFATVSGGIRNVASFQYAVVCGGQYNTASGYSATIGGGAGNTASGDTTVIGGGEGNSASGYQAIIGGGTANTASGNYSTVSGGIDNEAGGHFSFAAGQRAKVRDAATVGDSNGDEGAFVWADSTNADFTSTGPNQFLIRAAGGVGVNTNAPAEALDVIGNIHASGTITSGNSIMIDGTAGNEEITSSANLDIAVASGRALRIESNEFGPSIIFGYFLNSVSSSVIGATISGGGGVAGTQNRVTDHFGTLAGGQGNIVGNNNANLNDAGWSTVSGGTENIATGSYSTIGGGRQNSASGQYSKIGGGNGNFASAFSSTIAGGDQNDATGVGSTVGGGSGNIASGTMSTIPGGNFNQASGLTSFAGGHRAKSNHDGSFVWGDSTEADVASSSNNQFTARTVGGARFYSNIFLTTGVSLAAGGGSWSSISDRNVKRNIQTVDSRAILDRLTGMPIATWTYESQDESIRHIGPMAQDFHAAFSVGEDERYITGIDADGVALAAIQGLHSLVEEKDCQIQSLDSEVSNLKSEIDELKSLVKALADRHNKGDE